MLGIYAWNKANEDKNIQGTLRTKIRLIDPAHWQENIKKLTSICTCHNPMKKVLPPCLRAYTTKYSMQILEYKRSSYRVHPSGDDLKPDIDLSYLLSN